MQENDFGAGFVMLLLAVASLAVGILAIALRAQIARHGHRPGPGQGSMAESAPLLAGFAGGIAGFFVVAFFPWLLVVPAALFAAWAIGTWRRQGPEAVFRAVLLVVLAVLWVGLATYGDRMNRWSETVMGAIRVDLVVTAAMAAAWAFLGVWLWREVDPLGTEEVEEQAAPNGSLAAGVRKR